MRATTCRYIGLDRLGWFSDVRGESRLRLVVCLEGAGNLGRTVVHRVARGGAEVVGVARVGSKYLLEYGAVVGAEALYDMQKPSGKWCEARPARDGMRARRHSSLREPCVRRLQGGGGTAVRGGGAWLCAAEVHGWHALESCGSLSWKSRRSQARVDFGPRVTAFELTLPRCNGFELTLPRRGGIT